MIEHTIKFKPSGLFLNSYNENLKSRTDELIEVEDFEYHYDDYVEFDDNLTVEDFLTILNPFYEKIDQNFIAYTRGFKLLHYFEQMHKPVKENNKDYDDGITHIELHWICSLSEHENLLKGCIESDYEFYSSYHGIAKDCTYSLGFSPINEWKHYPIKLNKDFECQRTYYIENEDGEDEIKMETLFKSTKEWTLFEVLKCFFFEMTWFGYTDSIEEHRDEMTKISDEIDSGECETTELNFDEWKIEFLENDLKTAHETENYAAIERITNKINKLKNRIKNKNSKK